MDILDGGIAVWFFGFSMVGAGVLGALFVAWVGKKLLEEAEDIWAKVLWYFSRR